MNAMSASTMLLAVTLAVSAAMVGSGLVRLATAPPGPATSGSVARHVSAPPAIATPRRPAPPVRTEALSSAASREPSEPGCTGYPASDDETSHDEPSEAPARAESAPLVERIGPGRYRVSRALLGERWHPRGGGSPRVQVLPWAASPDATPTGVQLFGIREGSLLAQAGLRSRDVVLSVNGTDAVDPNEALWIYRRAAHGEPVRVRILRRGRRFDHIYQLAPER